MSTLVIPTVNEDCKSDTSSSTGILGMTVEQKEWFMAILNCDQIKVGQMLKQNPDLVNWKNYLDGNMSVHYAAKFGDCSLIRLLVGNYGAKVNAQNNSGHTPLHLAAIGLHEDAIHLLTSVYMADTCIRDFSGRCPSAYLSENSAGVKLQRYFKNPLKILLADQKNLLYLLARAKRESSIRSRSQSPANIRLPTDGTGDTNPPFSAQFPWKIGSQSQTDSDMSARRLTRTHRFSSRRSHSRESSRDKPRRKLTTNNSMPDSAGDIHRLSISKGRSRRLTTDNVLAQNIYATVRRKKEYSIRKENPFGQDSGATTHVESVPDCKSPPPIRRNPRQYTSHSNRESITSQNMPQFPASKSVPDLLDPNSDPASKQTSQQSSPSTPTNETQSLHSTDTDDVDRRCTLTALNN